MVRNESVPDSGTANHYLRYTWKKKLIMLALILLTAVLALYAISAGSAELSPWQVLLTLLGQTEGQSQIIIWSIRLPRVLAAMVAGIGLGAAGAVMQNVLRNPLASPTTVGIAQGAAFGAALAIVGWGAGSSSSTGGGTILISSPYLVTISAFVGAMLSTMIIIFLAQYKGVSPESMVLAGFALGFFFQAGTMLLQYFTNDVNVAAIVFWTFGDIGRAAWGELGIMSCVVFGSVLFFLFNRWNYNALDSGAETAKGLGVNVEKTRQLGMFFASLITATAVSFLGIIAFIGLVAPHLVRRLIGGDNRFLIPASGVMGALLLLAADTLARRIIAPVILPVGAVTSFLGAPLFLYLLVKGAKLR
ncbi:FecCD family ABC transporter permease [Desulfosporosinus youngiae]|uniref:ABC-type Fe3+-siderophore transport system, permease component n=1 Tax=Desulfosporosinus youngiae DSM 17734 TaxID=768710 RepID=H5Y679_9FIRM|nr:iron ABC transporter permease [Desulfosporosinus youngiae]EHQ91089.1 ABC-type Fe3+-siderophore transport system, permease component [Desulfosporosinus youngiae DSM 17734]